MTLSDSSPSGRVYLVGAGPGDPGLITLRGVECLRRADVVLYDYLVNPRILDHTRRDAERICLGQHGRTRIWKQEEINQKLIELAGLGKCVVRLKGGDPAIFARLADELQVLAQRGIPFEVVPGITAAVAAGSYAGIPVTHGELASAVALIAGQERTGKQNSGLDYDALARFPGTLVFYMPVTTVQTWSGALLAAGQDPATPVAVIRRCSLPDQVTVRCSLAEVSGVLTPSTQMRPPVVVVVGAVAAVTQSLAWFEQRPLFGVRVLITRPAGQAAELEARLDELGAHVLRQPAIEIGPPADWSPVDAAIHRLAEFDWLVFSSANGVRFFVQRLRTMGYDGRALAGLRLAAIGPGTARALGDYHLQADLQPAAQFRAESLAAALATEAAGKRFLLVRASRGREVLGQQLTAAGGRIEQVVAYSSCDLKDAAPEIAKCLEEGRIDWITVSSSAIGRSLVTLFGDRLRRARLASISPLTTATLQELGYPAEAEARQYTMAGLVAAIVEATG